MSKSPSKGLVRKVFSVSAVAAVCVGGMTLTAPSAQAANHNFVEKDRYYLALGDSLAQGYAPYVYNELKKADPGLGYLRLACGGENSRGFITPGNSKAWLGENYNGGGCSNATTRDEYSEHSAGKASQLIAAIDFIRAHPGQVKFISLSIGGNDYKDDTINTGFNVVRAVEQLRAAAGPDTIIVGSNWFNTFMKPWFEGDSGVTTAQAWQSQFRIYNDYLDARFREGTAKVADIGTAFNIHTPFSETTTYKGQTVPVAIASMCTWTRVCDTPPNEHQNAAGSQRMAETIAASGLGSSMTFPTTSQPSVTPTAAPVQPAEQAAVAFGSGKIELNWRAVVTGSKQPTGHRIDISSDNGANWLPLAEVGKTSAYTASGLRNGTAYRFRVTAFNSFGDSPSAVTSSVTAVGVPDAPSIVQASASNRTATISWQPPANMAGTTVTNYWLQRSFDGGQSWQNVNVVSPALGTTYSQTELTNGVPVSYRVAIITPVGVSAFSEPSPSVTPSTVPGQPTNVAAVPTNGGAKVSWRVPNNGGAAITGYRIEASDVSQTPRNWVTVGQGVGNGTEAEVSDLTNGVAYRFRVYVTNSNGVSAASTESLSARPSLAPGVVRNVVATAGDAQALVAWQAPQSNGGNTITGYRVEKSTDNGASWSVVGDAGSASREAMVTGLTNFVPHIFRVSAINVIGVGESAATTAVTPRSPAPRIEAVAAGDVIAAKAQLRANINANGSQTRVSYRFGTDPALQNATIVTPASPIIEANDSRLVTGQVRDLIAGTTYYYQAVAVSQGGTTLGPITEFTTLKFAKAHFDSAQSVTGTSAKLFGYVGGNGWDPTAVMFEYGQDESFATGVTRVASSQPHPGGTYWKPMDATVTGLAKSTKYYVRVLATNIYGTAVSTPVGSFTTKAQ